MIKLIINNKNNENSNNNSINSTYVLFEIG